MNASYTIAIKRGVVIALSPLLHQTMLIDLAKNMNVISNEFSNEDISELLQRPSNNTKMTLISYAKFSQNFLYSLQRKLTEIFILCIRIKLRQYVVFANRFGQ